MLLDKTAEISPIIDEVLSKLRRLENDQCSILLRVTATLELPESILYSIVREQDAFVEISVFELLEAGFNPDERGPHGTESSVSSSTFL